MFYFIFLYVHISNVSKAASNRICIYSYWVKQRRRLIIRKMGDWNLQVKIVCMCF